jgi:hypothetical protein
MGAAAAEWGEDDGSSSSRIAIIRARRASIRNTDEVQQQSSENAKHQNGEANDQDHRYEYLEEKEGRIRRSGKFLDQGCEYDNRGEAGHKTSERWAPGAKGVAGTKKRPRGQDWELQRVLRSPNDDVAEGGLCK